MFADGEHTAEAADDGTAGQAVDQDVAPDIFQRHQSRAHQQLPQAAQRAGRLSIWDRKAVKMEDMF